MRLAILAFCLVACGSQEPVAPPPMSDAVVEVPIARDVPCGGACGTGTACVGERCEVVAMDAGTVVDVRAEDRESPVDTPVTDVPMDTCASQTADNCCGVACRAATNTVVACADGRCRFTCNTDFDDCDGNAANGCETNTTTDRDNCGRCGNSCGKGDPTQHTVNICAGRRCALACEMYWSDCSPAIPGCEAWLRGEANCGRCGNQCLHVDRCVARDGGFVCF